MLVLNEGFNILLMIPDGLETIFHAASCSSNFSFFSNYLLIQKLFIIILPILFLVAFIIVRSVCVFSFHFRAQARNFVKSIIRTQKVKFGSDPKILPPDVQFTDQTTGALGQKMFLGFHFPIVHCKGHVLQTKVYKNIIPLFFVFQKLLRFINC